MKSATVNTDTFAAEIDAMLVEAYEIRNRDTKRSIALCDEAYLLSEKSGYEKGKAEALSQKGFCSVQLADYSSAINELNRALQIFSELNDETGLGNVKYNLGLSFMRMGDFNMALQYEMQSLEIREKINDAVGAANCYMQIGYIHEHFNDFETALPNYEKCYELQLKANNELGIASALMGLGSIAVIKNNHEKVKQYLDECLAIRRKLEDPRGLGAALHRYTTYYFQNKQFELARLTVQDGIAIAEEVLDKMGMTRLKILLGRILIEEGKHSEAIVVLQEALQLSRDINLKSIEYEVHLVLSDVYSAVNDFEHALESYRLFHKMREEVLNADVAAKIRNIETVKQMESANKEAEIHRLKNVELKEAYELIEEKNKDITDSINYARRIQHAQLPERKTISESLPESFVLFKPKDIVSGDFYFFQKSESKIVIAAGDCTGHGVPGALMSMIGAEKLKEAVSSHTDPSQILKQLNRGIKTSLRQSDSNESTRDGMDIALCCIDVDSRTVLYAGANRPFWLVKKGQLEVTEIKATKKAIGGFTDDDQHFDSHQLQLNPGDTIYLCTDGYADLFHGFDGKKLTTKKLKQLLVEIQHLTMPEQEQHLEEFSEKWKAGSEQIDDILILGIRLA